MPTDAGTPTTTSEDSMTTDTITAAEYDALRFPAHADILRRTTPITNAAARGLPDDADDVYPKGTLTGLVCGVMEDRAVVAWDCCEQWERVEFAGLSLDLTDATGRAHLAWWIHRGGCCDVPVCGIADLDPNDPRTLPDGSRLVDALALAAVGRWLLEGGK